MLSYNVFFFFSSQIYANRYRIEAKLGWGHFSTVWLATDLK
jgi:serine/threonine-protein kinase SRPK3